ncbi:YoaK family protein [Peptacetobacter hominis]|nr:YoaK family protein [Peptacetobacter hominis]
MNSSTVLKGEHTAEPNYTGDEFLECEKKWVFAVLMFVAGFYGAYTYTIRGGIFCNAQTANFVLLAMALGSGSFKKALYYVIPMSAYLLGSIISESFALRIKKINLIRWDTLLIIIEMIVVIILGMLPETAPYRIAQVSINFICSMQYNTFRQAEKVPMATTFCTNHVRQTGIAIVKYFRKRDMQFIRKMRLHVLMLFMFTSGGIISTILAHKFLGKAIWAALIPLSILLIDLLYADFKKEKGMLHKIPNGH